MREFPLAYRYVETSGTLGFRVRVFLVLEVIDTILDPCVALSVTVGWDHYSDLSYISHLRGIGFLGE